MLNAYLLPLQNLLGLVRDAWGGALFALLLAMALLVLLLMLVVDRGRGEPGNARGAEVPPAPAEAAHAPVARVALPTTVVPTPTPISAAPEMTACNVSPAPAVPAFRPSEAMPLASAASGRPLVLVVDDSAVVRLKLRRLLERAGYGVAVARNGIEALDALALDFYSVLVTDLEMPEMSGFELIASVHGSLDTEDLPIIAITGHDELQTRVHDYAGLYGLFRKPWNDRELLKRIATLAPVRQRTGEAALGGVLAMPAAGAVRH